MATWRKREKKGRPKSIWIDQVATDIRRNRKQQGIEGIGTN